MLSSDGIIYTSPVCEETHAASFPAQGQQQLYLGLFQHIPAVWLFVLLNMGRQLRFFNRLFWPVRQGWTVKRARSKPLNEYIFVQGQ